MKYRHEWKHEISSSDLLVLRTKLSAVMKKDSHSTDGRYEIRSLYFDSPYDTALREKIDGVDRREKFRLRLYNFDTSYITLEKKSKLNGLCSKESCPISSEQAQKIIDGDIGFLKLSDDVLMNELYYKMKSQCLKPKTVVDYTREPFVYAPGNVRVTIDYNIRTGQNRTDFLNPDLITVPAGEPIIILEVKWDEYLPDVIRDAVNIPNRRVSAFSKYAQCRIYG